MTEQKLPQPGEYWLSRGGTIRYVICDLLESCPERQDVYPLLSIGKHGDSQDVTSHDEYGFEWENTDPSNRDLVTRLPNCDSFDWTPSPAIDPGEGWELLPVGTEICDAYMGSDDGIKWGPTMAGGEIHTGTYPHRKYYRRRKPAEWPKYYIRTSGADSWVYRADGRYTIRNLTCNCVADPAEWYWRHGNMVEVTESEALARVAKPAQPADMPLNPVPGKVVATGACKLTPVEEMDLSDKPAPLPKLILGVATDRMVDLFLSWRLPSDFRPDGGISFTLRLLHENWPTGTNLFTASQARKMLEYVLSVPEEKALVTPVESPDDWVEITDPEHVLRKAIDEVRYQNGAWVPVLGLDVDTTGMRIRCRRRDLPAAAPKRIPVRLWIDQADGEVIVTTGDDYATCDAVELLHDADGFYVTEGEQ